METFRGVGGIAKRSCARSVPYSPARAARGSRVLLQEPGQALALLPKMHHQMLPCAMFTQEQRLCPGPCAGSIPFQGCWCLGICGAGNPGACSLGTMPGCAGRGFPRSSPGCQPGSLGLCDAKAQRKG